MSELALKQPQTIEIKSLDDLNKIASLFAASGFFKDAREAPQAAIKILAGQELGFPSFASMTGIHIIQGKPTMGANLMAATIKRSGRYNYRVLELTDKVCRIEFFENGQSAGVSEFTYEDAKRAGTQNLNKFPKNMLFARAISNGMRFYCPDLLLGAPIYTPEELGAHVNEHGDVIDVISTPTPESKPPQQESAGRAWLKSYAKCIKDIGFADADSKDDFIAFLRHVTSADIKTLDDIPASRFGILHQVFKDCEHAKKVVARWRETTKEATSATSPYDRVTHALKLAGFREDAFEKVSRKIIKQPELQLADLTDEHATAIEVAVDTVNAGLADWRTGYDVRIKPIPPIDENDAVGVEDVEEASPQ